MPTEQKAIWFPLLVSTLWILLPAQGSLLVDLDKALSDGAIDDDPWIPGCAFRGRSDRSREYPHYWVSPLGPDRSLRFIPCNLAASGSPIGCRDSLIRRKVGCRAGGRAPLVRVRAHCTTHTRGGEDCCEYSPEEDILGYRHAHTGSLSP